MYFSPATLTLVAGMLASPLVVSAGPVAERSTSLCNQVHYGAVGYPWQTSSTPGSFCSSKKPSNTKAWQAIPYADGYDALICKTITTWFNIFGLNKNNLKICNGGNSKASLPHGCNPPHKHSSTTSAASKSTQTTSSSVVSVVSSSSSSSAPASSSSSSSAAASSVVSASSAASSSSSASSVSSSSVVVSSSTPTVSSSSSSTDSATSTSSAATATATVDPLSDPVCELTYQVQYTNFTLTAPNGVWTGLTVGAAAQDASYMTYTLATSIDDCLNACSNINGCVFVNTYYDVNETENDLPKHTDGVLTCAMFSTCVPTTSNNNWGGQDDPNEIYNSNGYCLSGACS